MISLAGLYQLREMIHPADQWRVDRLIEEEEEKKMGLVPSNLDDIYESAEVPKGDGSGGGGLLPAGQYDGTIISAEVRDGIKPWVTAELSLKIQVNDGQPHSGKATFCDIELAPNTDKSGQPSKGKLGFVKKQLAALGYTGKLSEVEYNAQSFVGAQVNFTQKVDDHLDENGNPDQYARINPNTGTPYIDREVYLNELLAPGFGSQAAPASSEPAVY